MSNIFAWLFQLVFPMFKEYTLSKFKESRNQSKFFFNCVFYFAIVWQALIVFYLSEQASNNLELQKPIIQQYNALNKQNGDLKNSLTKLQEDYNQQQLTLIQTSKQLVSMQRKYGQPVTNGEDDEGNYVYDPKTHVMIKAK